MLVIRNEKMKAVGNSALRTFETDMLAHLAEFSPPLFKAVKADRMRQVIRFGITQARGHGITFRGPVRLYLELMLLFGSHFDSDPQYPWAIEILNDQDGTNQMQRAKNLYRRTRDYREKVGGPRDAYTLAALENIRNIAQLPLPFSSADIHSGMIRQMAQV